MSKGSLGSQSLTPKELVMFQRSLLVLTAIILVVCSLSMTARAFRGHSEQHEEDSKCVKCSGSGSQDCIRCNGNGTHKCGFCFGSGSVTVTCKTCGGSGKVGDDTCSTCSGARKVHETCDNCSGTGSVPCGRCGATGKETCTLCNGTGKGLGSHHHSHE